MPGLDFHKLAQLNYRTATVPKAELNYQRLLYLTSNWAIMGRSTTQQYALWTLVIFPKKVQRPMKQTNSTTPGERVHPLPPIEPGPGNNLVLRPVSVTATPRPPAPPPACQPPRPCDREATRRREVTRPTHRGCPAWFGSPFCPVLVSVCVSDLIWFRGGARD